MTARRITRQYARGVRISDEQMAQLELHPDTARARWNSEFRPHETAAPASPCASGSQEPAGIPAQLALTTE